MKVCRRLIMTTNFLPPQAMAAGKRSEKVLDYGDRCELNL